MVEPIYTGLFFGSFNPIHVGHLVIANYFDQFGPVDEVWFVISPRNPLKEKSSLLKDYHRLEMVHRAIGDYARLKVSSIEFSMPQPSYTIDTLTYLRENYPNRSFKLIMGADQLKDLHKWKNHEQLLAQYELLVYPRPGVEPHALMEHPHVEMVNAPVMEISASFIREAIQTGKDVRYFLPAAVWEYIREMHFYE